MASNDLVLEKPNSANEFLSVEESAKTGAGWSPVIEGNGASSPPTRMLGSADVATADRIVSLVRARKVAPRATYRCQFHNGFAFRDAAAVVPYLASLGISHLYASPVWHARPGSTHGYDVCNHQEFDEELGGEEGWNVLQSALGEHGMKILLDVVPNHMSTHAQNLWWDDMLENGPSSPYASYFDIDWQPVKPELDGRVLLPVLGRQYGEALEAGELRVVFAAGAMFLGYFDRLLPLDPKTAPMILGRNLDELRAALVDAPDELAEYESILTALDHLPSRDAKTNEYIVERQRDKQVIKRRLRELTVSSPRVREFIDKNISQINGTAGEPASFDKLDELCTAQVYRLSHWKVAGDEVNYRRFFDINELAALCIEDADAFFQTHRLVTRLLAEGTASGLRIDHIDGLYAPEQYLWRLQWAYLAELVQSALSEETGTSATNGNGTTDAAAEDAAVPPPDRAAEIVATICCRLGMPCPQGDDWRAVLGRTVTTVPVEASIVQRTNVPAAEEQSDLFIPLFVVVEKILGPHEPLPETWPVAGTTGYDFLQMCDGLFLPDDGWRQIKRDFARITGDPTSFEEVALNSKKLILTVAMAGELQMLAHRLNRISEQHRRSRDFTLNMLRYALREILICFPVYRIYPGPLGVSERDRHFVALAVAQAKRRNPVVDASLFDFVRDVLLLVHPAGLSAEAIRERELFAGRFQQVTSPVMAKGVEDTTFYVYSPLLSVNEVGNKPEAPVVAPAAFHAWNGERARLYPHAMLASSTHDTKRSEDVRSRLNILAEMPSAWRSAVQHWMRLNRRRRVEIDGAPAPSRGDEYLCYQSLVGVWPLEENADAMSSLTERMCQYMEKAVHEAKQRTSWINPNEAYNRSIKSFVTSLLQPRRDNRFLADLRKWQGPVARLGLVNGLAELVLKLTSPGFPDIYQGQECWAFRLVDPDNRGHVDYTQHAQLLAELKQTAGGREGLLELARTLTENPADPRMKLFVTWRLLELRRHFESLLGHSHRYLPLHVTGLKAEHVVAFARVAVPDDENPQRAIVVVVPRLVARLLGFTAESADATLLPCGPEVWTDTRVELPSDVQGEFQDAFTGEQRTLSGGITMGELLANFPVAVLAPQ
ncbi:MAG TPA: malto-oligosyltrehalose synthase [Pirellulales bacterium]|jgi:(1->4)-alpha-D-glucan 1-alpha-D-glucosylmutase